MQTAPRKQTEFSTLEIENQSQETNNDDVYHLNDAIGSKFLKHTRATRTKSNVNVAMDASITSASETIEVL